MDFEGKFPGCGGWLLGGDRVNAPPLSVLHVLPGLGFGGTEFTVYRLAQAERIRGVQSEIMSLKAAGGLVRDIKAAGIPHRSMSVSGGVGALSRWMYPENSKSRPYDIVQGWLYSGNIMAGVLAGGWPGSRVIWNLMQANVSPAVNGFKTRMLMKGGAWLSRRWPDRIVCNSLAAQEAHQGLGYTDTKMRIIPNGVDTGIYRYYPEARTSFCRVHGVSPTSLILGHLARWDPHKDHQTLVRSVGLLLNRGIDTHLFLAGPGVTIDNHILMQWIDETGFPERFHMLGMVKDTPPFLSSLDIFCLSSVGESSSYSLAEALACEVPSVVTDVGDSRHVLGDAGVVVNPSDPEAFCQGLVALAVLGSEERKRLGRIGRERIVDHYSFQKMVEAYQSLYQQIFSERVG
jgi:glycosyltransferase involved in cell wall biosynthesis